MSLDLNYNGFMAEVEEQKYRSLPDQRFTQQESGQFLIGFLSGAGLRSSVIVWTPRNGGAWLMPGLMRWWEGSGPLAMPFEELQRFELGRANYILRGLLETAARRGELHELIDKPPRERVRLLYQAGLGYLV